MVAFYDMYGSEEAIFLRLHKPIIAGGILHSHLSITTYVAIQSNAVIHTIRFMALLKLTAKKKLR